MTPYVIIYVEMGNKHWSKKEINIIRNNYKKIPDGELVRYLPRRTPCAIACERREMGLKYSQEFINTEIAKQIEKER